MKRNYKTALLSFAFWLFSLTFLYTHLRVWICRKNLYLHISCMQIATLLKIVILSRNNLWLLIFNRKVKPSIEIFAFNQCTALWSYLHVHFGIVMSSGVECFVDFVEIERDWNFTSNQFDLDKVLRGIIWSQLNFIWFASF